MTEVEHEQHSAFPLRRAMTTMDLSSSDIADLLGVTSQEVEKWLLTGPAADHAAKIGALAEIADILSHRLRDGMTAVVVRRRVDGYDGRNMLEVIADGDHERLLHSIKDSFDLTRVA